MWPAGRTTAHIGRTQDGRDHATDARGSKPGGVWTPSPHSAKAPSQKEACRVSRGRRGWKRTAEEEPRDQDSAARVGPRAGRRARAAGGRGCLSKGTRWRGNLGNLGNRWMAGGSAPPSRPCCLRFLPQAAVYAVTHPCVKTYRLQTAIIHYLAESVHQEFRRGLVRCFGFRLSHKAAVTVAPGDAVISSRGWDSLRS